MKISLKNPSSHLLLKAPDDWTDRSQSIGLASPFFFASIASMKSPGLVFASLLALFAADALTLHGDDKPLSEKEKIQALIKHVEDLKGATFVRNDSDYDSKTAARFLQRKWQSHDKEVKTAMDFIEKVASVSSTTSKAYQIRFKDGQAVKSGEYLKAQLKKLEKIPRELDQP